MIEVVAVYVYCIFHVFFLFSQDICYNVLHSSDSAICIFSLLFQDMCSDFDCVCKQITCLVIYLVIADSVYHNTTLRQMRHIIYYLELFKSYSM